MTHLDLTPLFRSTIGFDRLASLLDMALADDARQPGYPPYDIEVTGEDHYRITMAVAGLGRDDLSVDLRDQTLTVTGRKPDADDPRRFLYRGIARRGFVQRFRLADHVKVAGAGLENGLLTIALERELPEAMKPRTIEIGTRPPRLAEGAADKAA